VSFHFVQSRVDIQDGRARWPEADALFLPTNDFLWMAAGPALDVKTAAGAEVELEAVRQGPIKPGDIVLTDAGALPLTAIIHGAVMGQDLCLDGDAAARAIDRGLDLAGTKRWTRLLVHSLHATGRATRREAVQKALAAMVERLLTGSSVRQITLFGVDESERKALHEDLLRLIHLHG
jgi:hypothetical protein